MHCLLLLGFFLLFLPSPAGAQFPAMSLNKQISGLSFPVHITHAGDGSGQLFIVETTRANANCQKRRSACDPFSGTSVVPAPTGYYSVVSQGLLSVAFPPGFNAKGSTPLFGGFLPGLRLLYGVENSVRLHLHLFPGTMTETERLILPSMTLPASTSKSLFGYWTTRASGDLWRRLGWIRIYTCPTEDYDGDRKPISLSTRTATAAGGSSIPSMGVTMARAGGDAGLTALADHEPQLPTCRR